MACSLLGVCISIGVFTCILLAVALGKSRDQAGDVNHDEEGQLTDLEVRKECDGCKVWQP
jgi:hypothetical protein